MSHALSTFIAPLRPDRVGDAEAAIDLLGNPAREDIKAALDRLEPPPGTPAGAAVPPDEFVGTHFASLCTPSARATASAPTSSSSSPPTARPKRRCGECST
jgi:hypothetical protein